MHYRIGRGETGVLTFEPYKSAILPLWRFKTPALARQSSARIYDKFLEYYKVEERDGEGGVKGDFVGMDMCRKFLQMVCWVYLLRLPYPFSQFPCCALLLYLSIFPLGLMLRQIT